MLTIGTLFSSFFNPTASGAVPKETGLPGLEGPFRDIGNMLLHLTNSKVEVYDSFVGRRNSKSLEEVCLLIQEFFAQSNRHLFLIYYTGHGINHTGDWVFKDGELSFEMLMELWNTRPAKEDTLLLRQGRHEPAKEHLLVVSDCCFSGMWVAKARAYFGSFSPDVSFQSACQPWELAWDLGPGEGGCFTSMWLENRRMRKIFKIRRKLEKLAERALRKLKDKSGKMETHALKESYLPDNPLHLFVCVAFGGLPVDEVVKLKAAKMSSEDCEKAPLEEVIFDDGMSIDEDEENEDEEDEEDKEDEEDEDEDEDEDEEDEEDEEEEDARRSELGKTKVKPSGPVARAAGKQVSQKTAQEKSKKLSAKSSTSSSESSNSVTVKKSQVLKECKASFHLRFLSFMMNAASGDQEHAGSILVRQLIDLELERRANDSAMTAVELFSKLNPKVFVLTRALVYTFFFHDAVENLKLVEKWYIHKITRSFASSRKPAWENLVSSFSKLFTREQVEEADPVLLSDRASVVSAAPSAASSVNYEAQLSASPPLPCAFHGDSLERVEAAFRVHLTMQASDAFRIMVGDLYDNIEKAAAQYWTREEFTGILQGEYESNKIGRSFANEIVEELRKSVREE